MQPRAFNNLLGCCYPALLASVEFTNIVTMHGKWPARTLAGNIEVCAAVMAGVPATSVLLRLAQCPVLRDLRLSEVVPAHDVVVAVAKCLARPFAHLQSLTANVSERTAALLLSLVEPTLVHLMLWVRDTDVSGDNSSSRSGGDHCATWAALPRLRHLRHLRVHFVHSIPSPTAGQLLGLSSLAQLRELTLGYVHRIGDPSAPPVCLASTEWHVLLSRLSQLTRLSLDFPLFVADMALPIAGQLCRNLQYLNLDLECDLTSLEGEAADRAATAADERGDEADALLSVIFPKILELRLRSVGDRLAGER